MQVCGELLKEQLTTVTDVKANLDYLPPVIKEKLKAVFANPGVR